MYKQGDIVFVRFPLSDKPSKSIMRPAVVVSNEKSNSIDKDMLVCQITSRVRDTPFSFALTEQTLTSPLPVPSEVRCNKISTIRIWDKLVAGKITELKPESLSKVVALVKSSF